MYTATHPRTAASSAIPFDRLPRLVRFMGVGGACALLQLAALHVLVQLGIASSVANLGALLLCAQLNFALSQVITWKDRHDIDGDSRALRRLARFNGMVLVSALANQLTFLLVISHAHYLIAGSLALLVGAVINFTVSDRLVFTAE